MRKIVVKAITGLTPHGLIKQYRLKRAADLLNNSNMSVSEVIYETGFNSRSYFINLLVNCFIVISKILAELKLDDPSMII